MKKTFPVFSEFCYSPLDGFLKKEDCRANLHREVDLNQIPPLLRTLLISDGTVTKLLEAYYWEPIQVKRLFHGDFVTTEAIPAIELQPGNHVLHRRVILNGIRSDRIYSYASSYIRTDRLWENVRDDLIQCRLGIGELLRDRRVETYRELLSYEFHAAQDLAEPLRLKKSEPVISRKYRILIEGKPCLFLIESFPIALYAGHL